MFFIVIYTLEFRNNIFKSLTNSYPEWISSNILSFVFGLFARVAKIKDFENAANKVCMLSWKTLKYMFYELTIELTGVFYQAN